MRKLLVLLTIFLFLYTSSNSQLKKKQIKLDSSFQALSDRMEVKLGLILTGKMWNYKFGEYRLTKNKISGKGKTETSNFLNTKSEIESKAKFLFELSDNQGNSAVVNGSIQNNITALHEIRINDHLYVGEEGLVNSRRNFLATINLNSDTSTWKMLLIERSDSSWIGALTNGARNIEIIRIYHYEDGKSPAMGISAGCELKEGGETIGAVQYFGNRYNNDVVWIPRSFAPKEKCFLAAALTALMASAHNGQEFIETSID